MDEPTPEPNQEPVDATGPTDAAADEAKATSPSKHDATAEPSAEETEPDRQAEIAALKDKLARARADYDNLQKRQAREAALERDRVKARVLEHFLQVHEYGRMAAREAERSPGALADGVHMLVREFDRLLETEGVVRIGVEGEVFDASEHEAVAEQPAADAAPGTVLDVVAPGYRLGDRVLRFAKVVVAKAAD